MATWILVPCLVSLRGEFNQLSPGRDKTSDGSIGDAAHAGSSSDHNPDETGATPSEDADSTNEVHAIDVDRDLRKAGWDMARAVGIIVARHRAGRDDRLQNVIFNRRIWSRSWGWTAREYTGSNPHDHHAHFSARYTSAEESDTRPWGLLEEDDMPLTNADADLIIDRLLAREIPAAYATQPRAAVATLLKAASHAEVETRAVGSIAAALTALANAEGQRAAAELARDQAEASRDASVASMLAGLNTAIQALDALGGGLSDEQAAELTEQVRQAAAEAGAHAVAALTAKVDSLREHLGDDE